MTYTRYVVCAAVHLPQHDVTLIGARHWDFQMHRQYARLFPDSDPEPAPDTSPWMICPDCSGEGKHSRHLGSFTSEDIDRDWDPDDWQDYLQGAYDRQCDVCRGAGKVRTKAWATLKEARAEFASENHHHYERGY